MYGRNNAALCIQRSIQDEEEEEREKEECMLFLLNYQCLQEQRTKE